MVIFLILNLSIDFDLANIFMLRDWGNPCLSVTGAQLDSTYLVAVCEVSQSDAECAQHEGSSGNSCLQFETLLPALGLCWVTVCPAKYRRSSFFHSGIDNNNSQQNAVSP